MVAADSDVEGIHDLTELLRGKRRDLLTTIKMRRKDRSNRMGSVIAYGASTITNLPDTMTISVTIPRSMAPYIGEDDTESSFVRNAMMLFPFIHNLTISHGRAAEILGVKKTDLIEFYDSMGIPYLNQSNEELERDLAVLAKVVGGVS